MSKIGVDTHYRARSTVAELQEHIYERMRVDTSTVPVTGELYGWRRQDVGEGYIIWGHVHGDTKGRFEPGTFIRTSLVLKIENDIAVTLNSAYRLVGAELE